MDDVGKEGVWEDCDDGAGGSGGGCLFVERVVSGIALIAIDQIDC